MSSPNDKYVALTNKLYELTQQKRIKWFFDDFDDALKCKLSGYDVTLDETEDSDGTPYIRIRLLSSAGDTIDSFTDGTIGSYKPSDPNKNYWTIMSELFTMANRQASGADEALDAILKGLESK